MFFHSIIRSHKRDIDSLKRRIAILIGIVLNVGLAFAANRTDLPLYLDSAGTIIVTVLGGILPGLVTGVATNVLCSFFNEYALYYTFISVMIAFVTMWFAYKNRLRSMRWVSAYIVILSLIGGIFGTILQWFLSGGPQFKEVAETARMISPDGVGFFFSTMLVNTGFNVIDKSVTGVIAFFVIFFIPDSLSTAIRNSGWKQTPLSPDEILEANLKIGGHSLKGRMTRMLVLASVILTLAMSWISIQLHFINTKREYTDNAKNASKLAAKVIDPDKIEDFIRIGKSVPGYKETEDMLYAIRESSTGVSYLYVVRIDKDGCYFAFDLETPDTDAYMPGDRIDFEDAFEPYLPALFAGEEIPAIELNDISGWVLTSYTPVKNAEGKTVCYVGADVSMKYLSDFMRDFSLKTVLIFSGFFTLVLAYGMWISRYNLIYPIGSMTKCTKEFVVSGDDQKAFDNSVRSIRELKIHTDDEVEELYKSICKMSADMAEQVRSVRHYAAATAKMQNGLIITMADMVENRDSDTGAHIQKTAAYVRIVLEGLLEKGYYKQKITPNYISDVEMSAPLHDVGKINIPDAILNKPGKLTEEEFEIMKTHTTAGKKIIEKAINTLQGENYLKEARNMAAYHHERWDGKGYPEKLHGEVIPLSARVMAVADVFDALTSPRVYKPAFPLEKAIDMIREGAGTQFDPKCVEAFLDSIEEVKVILKKYNGDM